MPEPIATFRGPVSCTRSAGRAGFALAGLTAERPGEPTTLVFPAPAPADLPASLNDALIEQLAAGEYRISGAGGTWRIAAASVEVHREVAAGFYRSVPPRPLVEACAVGRGAHAGREPRRACAAAPPAALTA